MYNLMGMAWYMIWTDAHGVFYDMTWRACHGLWYGLVGMAWYIVWHSRDAGYMVRPSGHGM